jgi:hypothetical protein
MAAIGVGSRFQLIVTGAQTRCVRRLCLRLRIENVRRGLRRSPNITRCVCSTRWLRRSSSRLGQWAGAPWLPPTSLCLVGLTCSLRGSA